MDKKNEKIKNIALTGSYGSGKSSILQSFEKQNTNKKLQFLNISLATFKEEKEIKDKTEGENLLRLIELSILQQLFYREKDRKLPDSRLKKIKSFTWKNLLSVTIGSFLFLVSLFLFIKPDILSHILPEVDISDNVKIIIHYVSLILCILGFTFIILKSIRLFHNLKISKLKISNAKIEISPEINKSVLNHNLEEILYFFEATEYNVVIIEDLDRFQETEIFTKLRELNLLINNSKKINRRVTFIYALRDEMFADKDRTKFFDFIIPVIPHIYTSNSNEILQREIARIADKVSESLIDDISLFIDEMRLLHNIINEFQIYKQLLSDKLIQDKLLAMIVYKNICPDDFVKLSNYKGDLYDTINKKREYIKQQSNEIENKIAEHKEEIKQLDTLKIKDIKELRALYVLQYIKQINTAYKINSFHLNNNKYNFEQVLEDSVFPYLISSDPIYFGTAHQQKAQQSIKFQDIEKQVDAKYTYKEREEQIKSWHNGKIQELKQQVASLEQKNNELNRKKIGELLSNKNVSVEPKDNKQELIKLLLRNGYIAEDYLDYISIFHEGSISRNDHTFLLNVKSQTKTDFTHPLDKIDKLISKISLIDFEKEYILNYQLVDFVLDNMGYEKQKEAIFKLLKKLSNTSVKFIDGFIDNGIRIDLFIKELYHCKIDVFDLVYRNSNLPDKRLSQYFKLVIENADIEDIKAISEKSFLSVAIADNPNDNYDIFDLVSDETKIKTTLKGLNIKFKKINPHSISEDMLNYICQNNHYQINVQMLKLIIQAKGNFNQVDFDARNYYAIQNSNCIELASYIDSNISEYIDNVYLKLETNTQEKEDCLIILLNKEDLDIKQKEAIIQKVETKISRLTEIKTIEVDDLLFENSKLQPNWKDIIIRFENSEIVISESIIMFLNNIENAKTLSKTKIDKEGLDEDTIKTFSRVLMLNRDIHDDSYSHILKSIPYIYSSLSFESLTEDKVNLLIKNNRLELSSANYTVLRDNFPNLHIDLIEKRYSKLTNELLGELSFDNDDITLILESFILPINNKQMIVDAYDEDEVINSAEILSLLRDLALNQSFKISKDVLMAVLTQTKDIELRIKLYNNQRNRLNKEDITTFLNSLPEPYSEIAKQDRQQPLLPDSATNEQFAQILESKRYISSHKKDKKGIRIYKRKQQQ